MPITDFIVNAASLIARLGHWPSFHDAEVVRVVLDRQCHDGPAAAILIHVWNTLSELDDRGCYRMDKHTLVELCAAELLQCEINGFNHQNVILDLGVTVELIDNQPALTLKMSTSYGLSAKIVCRSLQVKSVEPCHADGSIPPSPQKT